MADEIDPLTVPAVLPAHVPRTEYRTAEGKLVFGLPTKFALLQEQEQQSWFVNNTIRLQTKITTVEAQQDGIAASVVTETNARISADSALATQITTVAATADDATANGAIYFAAKAGPTGSAAAYGLYLTAGSSFAGFEALALSGGGSAIGMTADKFVFTDAGTTQAVFTYSAGVWVLNSNMVIRSGTSGARQILTNENTKIYDASNNLRVAIGINI